MLEVMGQMQHPNIADILDVYAYDGKLYIVGEHLDVSLFDLEFEKLVPEEWEIATIITEVALHRPRALKTELRMYRLSKR